MTGQWVTVKKDNVELLLHTLTTIEPNPSGAAATLVATFMALDKLYRDPNAKEQPTVVEIFAEMAETMRETPDESSINIPQGTA